MADKKENNRHHECELFKRRGPQEAAESDWKWRNCEKNPDHKEFISTQNFKDSHLSKVQNTVGHRVLRACIDLTVRLRVHYTSTERPDDDEFSLDRGSDKLRTGTGFIRRVFSPMFNTPCPCVECDWEIAKKHWMFIVSTAHHVVYDTEEAKLTKVDMFLDDKSCDRDGRMKSVWGVEVWRSNPDRDGCEMLCATCDEDLGEKIESDWLSYDTDKLMPNFPDLSGLNLSTSGNTNKACFPAMIVSHPHGQPKKITMGEVKGEEKEYCRPDYTVPTCPGSSGAPVFKFRYYSDMFSGYFPYIPPVHSGSYDEISTVNEDQLNFGFDSF